MPKRTFSQVEQADNMQGKRLRSRIIAHVHARVHVPTTLVVACTIPLSCFAHLYFFRFASSLNEGLPAAPDVESMSRPRRSGRLNAGSERSVSHPINSANFPH